jgi:hypothetical protein
MPCLSQFEEDLDTFKQRVLTQAVLDLEPAMDAESAHKTLAPPEVRPLGWMFK